VSSGDAASGDEPDLGDAFGEIAVAALVGGPRCWLEPPQVPSGVSWPFCPTVFGQYIYCPTAWEAKMAVIVDIPTSAVHPAADAVQALRGFRQALYRCLTGWADALFELSDAVLCSPGPVSSVPMLSLEPNVPARSRQPL
jgi:hypothetical protein